jgi:hypothetical protein
MFLNPRNGLLYSLFTVLETIAFVTFLFLELKNQHVKKALTMIGLCFLIFNFLFPMLYNEKLIDSVQIGVETIIILVFSFYYLYEETNDTSTLYIYSTSQFWVIIGMVLYLSGSFFIYLFADSIGEAQAKKYWPFTNVFSVMKNLFFAIAIIINSKPPKKLPMSELEFSSLN